MSRRTSKTFSIRNTKGFKEKLFLWSKQFYTSTWLDSNNHTKKYSDFDVCLAADELTSIQTDYQGGFEKLKEYQSITKDYIFGYITYDVKNDIEKLSSNNIDSLGFHDLYFYQPQKIIFLKGENIEFHYLEMVDNEIETDFDEIQEQKTSKGTLKTDEVNIKPRISKELYFDKITKILEHIQRGDIYEMNFCQEFYSENTNINPHTTYSDLNTISESPFATFMRIDDKYLLSASPERYIKKSENRIISQPIKGTAKRFEETSQDEASANELSNNEKERSENIMIVDLVRNDLAKTAKKGTVNVNELCKVYSFKQVHQMISTVTSEVEHTTNPVEIISNTFPMGSMTGAPKVSAMKIIEELEESKRGLYSGTVGYFTPENDFDFNVIIRSILYNSEKKYVSYTVGGAITSKSTAEGEYKECLLKAKAMKEVLQKNKI